MLISSLFLFLLFSDVEVNELSFFPVFRPFLAVGLDELALSVPHVILVGAGEDVAGAEGVLTLALLNTVSPLAFIDSSIVFVFIGSFPVSDSLLPLAVVDVTVGVSVLPFAVLLIFG